MAEEVRRDFDLMRRGVFQPHGRRRCGVHRGGGEFQVPGKDVGPVRQILAGGPSECREGMTGLELFGIASTEGEGGAMSVRHFYWEMVQAVLLFGAETWVLSEAVYRNL